MMDTYIQGKPFPTECADGQRTVKFSMSNVNELLGSVARDPLQLLREGPRAQMHIH